MQPALLCLLFHDHPPPSSADVMYVKPLLASAVRRGEGCNLFSLPATRLFTRAFRAPSLTRLSPFSPLQILPSGDLTKGPGGFFNATLTLDSANRGRYICLANNNRGHDHKEVFVVDGGSGGDSTAAAGGFSDGVEERGK